MVFSILSPPTFFLSFERNDNYTLFSVRSDFVLLHLRSPMKFVLSGDWWFNLFLLLRKVGNIAKSDLISCFLFRRNTLEHLLLLSSEIALLIVHISLPWMVRSSFDCPLCRGAQMRYFSAYYVVGRFHYVKPVHPIALLVWRWVSLRLTYLMECTYLKVDCTNNHKGSGTNSIVSNEIRLSYRILSSSIRNVGSSLEEKWRWFHF